MNATFFGFVLLLAGLSWLHYHLHYVAPGIYKKVSAIAKFANTLEDHACGIGGCIALSLPVLISVTLIAVGIILI